MTEQKIVIRYLKRSKLKLYERNAMNHSDDQVSQLAASITAFGWTNPVLIDEAGEIIAGHGRLAAAKLLGIDDIPTITLAGLTDEQKRAYRLADNKLPANARWDDVLLKSELRDLSAGDFDLSLIGFSDDELGVLLGDVEEIDFDKDEDSGGIDINYLITMIPFIARTPVAGRAGLNGRTAIIPPGFFTISCWMRFTVWVRALMPAWLISGSCMK